MPFYLEFSGTMSSIMSDSQAKTKLSTEEEHIQAFMNPCDMCKHFDLEHVWTRCAWGAIRWNDKRTNIVIIFDGFPIPFQSYRNKPELSATIIN